MKKLAVVYPLLYIRFFKKKMLSTRYGLVETRFLWF